MLPGDGVCCKPSPQLPVEVSGKRMQEVYERIKTPYKYGVVFQHSGY